MAEIKKKIIPIKNKKSKKLEKEIISPFRRLGIRLRPFTLKTHAWIYLVILSGAISLLLFPNILTTSKEEYALGDVAKKDIKAPHDFLVEDKELTKQRRDESANSSLFVYDFDRSGAAVKQKIRESFGFAKKELQPLLEAHSEPSNKSASTTENAERLKTLRQARNKFFGILGIPEEPVLFDQLAGAGFSSQIENSILIAVNQIFEKGIVGNKTVLMSQKGKGIILRDIDTQKELSVDDLDRFYDLESARRHISQFIGPHIKEKAGPGAVNMTIRCAQLVIQPNITFNKKETELRKNTAKESVKPIYFQVKNGEMLVREGEKITPTHLLKLETAATLKRNSPALSMVLGMAILIGTLLSLSYLLLLVRPNSFKASPKNLFFSSLTLLFMFLFVLLYNIVAEEFVRGFSFFSVQVLLFAVPISLGAMLIAIFQGLDVAITFSLIISVLASMVVGGRVPFFVYFLLGSLLAAYGVRNCRERTVLIKTGMKVGLLNVAMALSIQTLSANLYSMASAISLVAGFFGGVLAGVIASGFLPLIEMAFGFTTDIKLLELSSLDQPILRDLMVNAPGTYHHSVVVSNMVEATAESIDANPLLAKVSAYYHDIGKIRKPLYFVENQVRGENKHEKLAPSMSSLILISHVKDGVELAKQHKLGKEIIDIIQQHHGTSLISYFYQKAKEQRSKKGARSSPVKEEDFRYPGPKPQNKEAGLVLLADTAEAASRTLVDPTPARIQGMVQKIINNVFSDGQLSECELTLKDLNQIARSFTKTLSGIFHSRVEYPEPIIKGEMGKKRGNGSTNHLQTPQENHRPQKNQNEAGEDLKRLGI